MSLLFVCHGNNSRITQCLSTYQLQESRWPGVPVRRKDVILTRLRIGHTRFTHKHLLFDETAPICTSCQAPYSVLHILIECPVFTFQSQSFLMQHFHRLKTQWERILILGSFLSYNR
ncbi:hypothetical protein AVEN_233044-1 [Araneus ventricosus]|uniref:Uncharacterized protein n=1 Tax=Araneus ventricosus TaxID=182803 RepID=A0A4Y2PM43_ARAVE|nr:hypothetical protein AVEN_233044-1 [Araneus ventricosus]